MDHTSIPNPWLLRVQPGRRARLRLLCIPFAGGGANVFRDWPWALPPTVELCVLQLPGRERRILEPSFVDIGPLVEAMRDAVLEIPELPLVVFGHSMGALLAFQLARELRRKEKPQPLHLFVSGYRAPQLRDPEPPVHHLPDAAFLERVSRLDGLPARVLDSPDLLQLLMPSLRADYRLCETYVYESESPLAFPITVFGGMRDPMATRPQLEAWREQTSGSFTLRMFPGNHFFLESSRGRLLKTLFPVLGQLAADVERR